MKRFLTEKFVPNTRLMMSSLIPSITKVFLSLLCASQRVTICVNANPTTVPSLDHPPAPAGSSLNDMQLMQDQLLVCSHIFAFMSPPMESNIGKTDLDVGWNKREMTPAW